MEVNDIIVFKDGRQPHEIAREAQQQIALIGEIEKPVNFSIFLLIQQILMKLLDDKVIDSKSAEQGFLIKQLFHVLYALKEGEFLYLIVFITISFLANKKQLSRIFKHALKHKKKALQRLPNSIMWFFGFLMTQQGAHRQILRAIFLLFVKKKSN